jgi:hypothetical protein
MTVPAVTVLSYLWHYLVARVVYDQLIRPVLHGDAAHLTMLACVAAVAFALGRWIRRRA